jgi:hypothetical protein
LDATGSLTLGSSVGTVNITGATTNINTSNLTSNVNIKTGNNSTGTITIGKNTDLTTKTTTTIAGNVNIATTAPLSAPCLINIGTELIPYNSTTTIKGDLVVGEGSNNTTMYGGTTIIELISDSISGTASDSTMLIGLGMTTGDPLNNNLAITIGEDLTTGNIEIGKSQTTGKTYITKIVSNSLEATTPTETISIGSNQTDGIINIGTNGLRTSNGRINLGNSASPTDINGDLTVGEKLYSTNILDSQVDGTQDIYTTKTSGNLDCLAIASTATLNVRGTGGIKTNNISSIDANGALTIGTNQTSGGTIGIGSASSTTTLAGTVNLPSTYARLNVIQTFNAVQSFTGTIWGLLCSRIGGITGQTTQSLFDNIANSNITIGSTSGVTVDNTLNCDTYNATTATGGTMTIGNNATTTRINIGNSQTNGRLDIGQSGTRTGEIYIGGAASTTYAGGTVNIGETTTTQTIKGSIVNVGSSGSTTNIKGGLTLDAPITPNYSYPVAAQTIGSFTQNNVVITSPLTTALQTVCSITVPSAGIYILTVNAQFQGSLGVLYFLMDFTGTGGATDSLLFNSNIGVTTIITGGFYGVGNTFLCAPTGAGTYRLKSSGVTGSFVVSFANIHVMRIA